MQVGRGAVQGHETEWADWRQVMRPEEMRLKVTTLSSRLSRLHHYLNQLSPRDRREFPEMVEHLQGALEELCSADEELEAQNHVLLESQRHVDEEREDFRELFHEMPFGYVMKQFPKVL